MSPRIQEHKPIGSYGLAEPSSCRTMAENARIASRQLAIARGDARNAWLLKSASALALAAMRSSQPMPSTWQAPGTPASPPPPSIA